MSDTKGDTKAEVKAAPKVMGLNGNWTSAKPVKYKLVEWDHMLFRPSFCQPASGERVEAIAAIMRRCFPKWEEEDSAAGRLFQYKHQSITITMPDHETWRAVRMDSRGDEVGAYVNSRDLSDSVLGIEAALHDLLEVPLGTRLVYKPFVNSKDPEAALRAAMTKNHPEFKLTSVDFESDSLEFEFKDKDIELYIRLQDGAWFLELDKSGDEAWEYCRKFKTMAAMLSAIPQVLRIGAV